MKKVKTVKGFVIAETNQRERTEGKDNFEVFFKDEWVMGDGCRYSEYECGSLSECLQNIANYQEVR